MNPTPRNPDERDRIVQAIEAAESILPDYVIALIVAPVGTEDGAHATCIGNCGHDGIGWLLKEVVARWGTLEFEPS